jgi:hypothetical protein
MKVRITGKDVYSFPLSIVKKGSNEVAKILSGKGGKRDVQALFIHLIQRQLFITMFPSIFRDVAQASLSLSAIIVVDWRKYL